MSDDNVTELPTRKAGAGADRGDGGSAALAITTGRMVKLSVRQTGLGLRVMTDDGRVVAGVRAVKAMADANEEQSLLITHVELIDCAWEVPPGINGFNARPRRID